MTDENFEPLSESEVNQETAVDTSSQTSKPRSKRAATSSGKVTIRASVEDGVLEPDSMRGSEMYLQEMDVEDKEEQRREEHRKLTEKK